MTVPYVPYGTSLLLITTSDSADRQFSGIQEACRDLARAPSCYHLVYERQALDLSRRRNLRWVVISGHGSADTPRVGNGGGSAVGNFLLPNDIKLPSRTYLLLLSCYQGREVLIKRWIEGTGAAADRALGSTGETESALSTLFLLHLLEQDTESILFWFAKWQEANGKFRPHFPLARRIYQQNHGSFLRTMARLGEDLDLSGLEEFFTGSLDYSNYLDRLA